MIRKSRSVQFNVLHMKRSIRQGLMQWWRSRTGQALELPYARTQDNEIGERAHRWNEDFQKVKESRYSLGQEGD